MSYRIELSNDVSKISSVRLVFEAFRKQLIFRISKPEAPHLARDLGHNSGRKLIFDVPSQRVITNGSCRNLVVEKQH